MRAAATRQKRPEKPSLFRNLGLALKVLRELRDLSQADLAREAGLGKSQLSKYENGKELPKLDSLEKALDALGTDPVALFYVVHLLDRVEAGARPDALLLESKFEPLVVPTEQEAYTRLIQDVVSLFRAQVTARVTNGQRALSSTRVAPD